MGFSKKEYPPEYLAMIKQFRLIDDTFFAACLDDDVQSMEAILKPILGRDDIKVESVVTQRSAQNLYGRGVRFDVLAYDITHKKVFNCEVQRAVEGAIPRRARANSSLIDQRELAKGQDFKDLPDTYVIFIMEKDIFKRGLPIYHVERVIKETNCDFGDDAHIIYVNGEVRDNTPLGRLMQDFFEPDVKKMHSKALAERVDFFKSNEKGVNTMCEIMEKFGARREAKGKAEGRTEGRLNTLIELVRKGRLDIQYAAPMSGMSPEAFRKLVTPAV